MPVPIFAAVGAGVLAGLIQFFTTRAGSILAGLGITMIAVKSFEALVGFILADMIFISGELSSLSVPNLTGGGDAGFVPVLQIMAHLGLFDFVNIVISAYLSCGSLIGMKIMYGRMK